MLLLKESRAAIRSVITAICNIQFPIILLGLKYPPIIPPFLEAPKMITYEW